MEKISPYYELYLEGLFKSGSKGLEALREASKYLEEALTYKKTEEAYKTLLICYSKLNNFELYEKTLLRACEDGFGFFYSLCGIYYGNIAKEVNKEESLKWFEKGLESKNPQAYIDFAAINIKGCRAFSADVDKAIEILKEGLGLNNNDWNGLFAYNLGIEYKNKKEYEEARNYFELAGKYGYKKAYLELSVLYKYGLGVTQDNDKFVEYLLMNIDDKTSYFLGEVFGNGECTTPNVDIATRFFKYSADHGNGNGCFFYATFLSLTDNYDANIVDYYFEQAFKIGIDKEWFKESYFKFYDLVDERTKKKIDELEVRYWKLMRNQA